MPFLLVWHSTWLWSVLGWPVSWLCYLQGSWQLPLEVKPTSLLDCIIHSLNGLIHSIWRILAITLRHRIMSRYFKSHEKFLFNLASDKSKHFWQDKNFKSLPILFRWAKDQNINYEGRIVFILTIQFDLKNKEITLVRGLTSVQNKQEINVIRTKNN